MSMKLLLGMITGIYFFVNVPVSSGQNHYKVQSIFVYQFIKHTEWPNTDKSKGLKIAVLGKSPVLDHLKQLAAKKGHSVSVMKKITEATKYDVIFITEGQSKKLSEIEEVVGNKSTLIITEQDGLAQAGSTVNFVNRNGAIAFEVNQNSLSRYNLKMSSEIKKLAILL